MKVYHGTDKDFNQFDSRYILSGEGVAKRGFGINFTQDKEVAHHYFESTGQDKGFIVEAVVPDTDWMLALDESALDCLPNKSLYELAESLASRSGLDLEEVFDEAAEHEDVSMTYADSQAETMFERLVVNNRDQEALEELQEWSPGYDWGEFIEKLQKTIGFEFDEYNNGLDVHNYLASALGGGDKAAAFLLDENIKGTYGAEPFSENYKTTMSYVVFDQQDITIHNKERIESTYSQKNKRKMRP